jgi:cullin-associated NEDD8-dissociated protein 1
MLHASTRRVYHSCARSVDDGLEARKTAYECMGTLLSTCSERLDFVPFIQRIVDGLTDDADIKLLCHRMLVCLANPTAPFHATTTLRTSLEFLVEPLRLTVCAVLKDNAVPQQSEPSHVLPRRPMYPLQFRACPMRTRAPR